MALTQKVVTPILVDNICDVCGDGKYRPVRTLLVSPPRYVHECNKCNDVKTFGEQYPYVRHMEDGEELDLSSEPDNQVS